MNTTSIMVEVPLAFRRRGGRKVIQAPDGTTIAPAARREPASTLVKAIARAHRWQRMLESGDYASVADLAAAERINPSYLARVLRLTLLAPAIVEAVVEGRQVEGITLEKVMGTVPVVWEEQARSLFAPGATVGL